VLGQNEEQEVVVQTVRELLVERDSEVREWRATGADVTESNRHKARARPFTYAHANLVDLMGDLENRGLDPNILTEPLPVQIQGAIMYEPDLWEIRLCSDGLLFEPEAMIECDWNAPNLAASTVVRGLER